MDHHCYSSWGAGIKREEKEQADIYPTGLNSQWCVHVCKVCEVVQKEDLQVRGLQTKKSVNAKTHSVIVHNSDNREKERYKATNQQWAKTAWWETHFHQLPHSFYELTWQEGQQKYKMAVLEIQRRKKVKGKKKQYKKKNTKAWSPHGYQCQQCAST